MILFILSTFLLGLFVYEIYDHLSFFNKLEKLLALFLISSSYLILILEIAGLLNSLNEPFVILSIQLSVCFITFIINHLLHYQYKGLEFNEFRSSFYSVINNIKKYWGISIYAGFIFLVYLFLLYIEFEFPQSTSDSLTIYLSRVGYWLQQGSLKTYFGFINTGSIYPYNNSLLMLWSVIFLRADKLVGLVQYFATLVLSLTIYLTGNELGFSKKGNVLAALITLTFPIIIFESITAQSDILVACFLLIAFYFLLKYIYKGNPFFLITSILAYALALGTKQNAIFSLPGYIALYLFSIIRYKNNWKSLIFLSLVCTLLFTVSFGGYAYIQNWANYGSPTGDSDYFQKGNIDNPRSLFDNVMINSVRLGYQFLNCEGIPPQTEFKCIRTKTTFFQPILTKGFLNIETKSYLADPGGLFKLDKLYSLNEDEAWFGFHGWQIFSISLLFGLIYAIKNKSIENMILISTSILFFLITSGFISLRGGWDPYIGRFLIFPIALIIPYSSLFFNSQKKLVKLLIYILCIFSIFSMLFCILNNDSRPLMSKKRLVDIQFWGSQNSILVQKIAYKLTPMIRNELYDSWSLDRIALQTITNSSFYSVINMVNEFSTQDSRLGILAPPARLPDYLFFGDTFDREVVPLTGVEGLEIIEGKLDFLLVSPKFTNEIFPGYTFISSENDWRLFESQ